MRASRGRNAVVVVVGGCTASTVFMLFQLFLVGIVTVQGWIPAQHHSCLSRRRPEPYLWRTSLSASNTKLRELYPPMNQLSNGTLQVDDIHTLFYAIYGEETDDTKPKLNALFLHGGPGAGCFPNHARFFDPAHYNVVLLDQRGCGLSTPRGEARNNTLQHLVNDCERIRTKLLGDSGKWDLVLGGSWGTTLAIAYGQTFPSSIRGMILRGVCLLRQAEIDWLFSETGGAANLVPQAWEQFEAGANLTEEESKSDDPRAVLHRYYDRLWGTDVQDRQAAAQSWSRYEFLISSSHKLPPSLNISDQNATRAALFSGQNETYVPGSVAVRESSLSEHEGKWIYRDAWGRQRSIQELNAASEEYLSNRLVQHIFDNTLPTMDQKVSKAFEPRPVPSWSEAHVAEESQSNTTQNIPAQNMLTSFYSANERFVKDGADLLDQERMDRLRTILCVAIHGGQDRICPPDTAFELAENWPELELRVPLRSGHSMYDPAITHELVQATDKFASFFRSQAS